jgi:hypothetical protein
VPVGHVVASVALNEALTLPCEAVTVSAGLLQEGLEAVRALETLLFSVGLLMVQHVAQFRCLNVTVHALEKLVGTARLLVHHILLQEAHVTGVTAEPVADALLDDFFVRLVRGPDLFDALFLSFNE